MDPQIDMHSINKDSAKSELGKAFHIALFKEPVMQEVAKGGPKTTTFGYVIIILSAILGIIGSQLFPMSVAGISFNTTLTASIMAGIFRVIGAIIGIHVMSFIATKLFGGKATSMEFFRVAAYSMVVSFLMIFPALSIIPSLWSLILMIVVLKAIHKVSTGGAIGTIIVTGLAFMAVGFVLVRVLGFGMFGAFGGISSSTGGFNPYANGLNMNFTDPATGKTGSVQYNANGVQFKNDATGESGSVQLNGNTMQIKGPDGKMIEIKVPAQN